MVALDTTSRVVAILSWISKYLSFVGKAQLQEVVLQKTLIIPGLCRGFRLCLCILGGFSRGWRKMNADTPSSSRTTLSVFGLPWW